MEKTEEKIVVSPNNIDNNNINSIQLSNGISFQDIEQYNMYMKGLETSVEQYKKLYPEKYEKAQSIGDDMMNKKYDLVSGEDLKGDLLKCKNILMSVLHYGLELNDLYENEIQLLKRVFTSVLHIVKDINDIIENVKIIENIINLITNKLYDYENYY